MGAFAEYQPLYAAHHIVTFPVDHGQKKPSVARPQRISPAASKQLTLRFPANDALGFWAGPRNGLTVLDIDVPDERVLADRLDRHGQTPFIVRSPSGKFHAYYRHNGERRDSSRKLPGFADYDGQPIDLLGSGLVVAPPSNLQSGPYTIIRGKLDDLDRLPSMRGLPTDAYENRPAAANDRAAKVAEGRRNAVLWSGCMKVARYEDTLDDLIDWARTFNENALIPPLPDDEVVKVANSAWSYEQKGTNLFGRGSTVMVRFENVDQLAASNPDAFALLAILKRHHSGCSRFFLAKAMAESMGWRLQRWKAAREALVAAGLICCIHAGGRGKNDPPVYGWPV